MPQRQPQSLLLLTAILGVACSRVCAQAVEYEYLFAIGGDHGIQPRRPLSGKWGRFIFGKPSTGAGLQIPSTVAVDLQDRIWIGDRGAGGVHILDLRESRYQFVGSAQSLRCPGGIDIDSIGQVYVTDACTGRILVFEKDGSFQRLLAPAATLQGPLGIAVSPDRRRIYVADRPRGRVVVLNQEGESVQEWFETEPGKPLQWPVAVLYDSRIKRFLVVQGEHRSVPVYRAGGEFDGFRNWEPVKKIRGLAIDPEKGRYFVGDGRYEAVHVFDQRDRLIGSFGQSGSGDGENREPASLYVDFRGRVYLVDALNGRVLVYREKGEGAIMPRRN